MSATSELSASAEAEERLQCTILLLTLIDYWYFGSFESNHAVFSLLAVGGLGRRDPNMLCIVFVENLWLFFVDIKLIKLIREVKTDPKDRAVDLQKCIKSWIFVLMNKKRKYKRILILYTCRWKAESIICLYYLISSQWS